MIVKKDSGEKHIRDVKQDDDLSRKVIPDPREAYSEAARRKLKEHERRSREVEAYERDIQRAHEVMRKDLKSNFSEDTLNKYIVETPEFLANDVVLVKWGKQWMQGKVMKVEEGQGLH